MTGERLTDAQLQTMSREGVRAHYRIVCEQFAAERELRLALEDKEALANEAITAIIAMEAERDALRAALTAAETERDVARRAVDELTSQVIAIERERDDAHDKGFDAGMEHILGAIVCSVCGTNHDADESAACDGCDPLRFDAWVEQVRRERDDAHAALREARISVWALVGSVVLAREAPGLALHVDRAKAILDAACARAALPADKATA